MSEELGAIRKKWLDETAAAKSTQALYAVQVGALGKSGEITLLLKQLGQIAPEKRKEEGQRRNVLKDEIGAAIEARRAVLEAQELEEKLKTDLVDVTLPSPPAAEGRVHPISQTIDEIVAIFGEMGFTVAEGPDIEDDFHNFTALNIPPEHPAREMHDTFFFAPGADGERKLLRTHTSPVQIRAMRAAMANKVEGLEWKDAA